MASFFEDYQKKKSGTEKNVFQQAVENVWTKKEEPAKTQSSKTSAAKTQPTGHTNTWTQKQTAGSSKTTDSSGTKKTTSSSSPSAKKTVTPSNVSSKSNTSKKFVPNTKMGGFYADFQARQAARQQQSGTLFGGQVSSPISGGSVSSLTNRKFVPSTVAGRKTTNTTKPTISDSAEKTRQYIQNRVDWQSKNGNVDLANRPIISTKKLELAGWGHQENGIATVYSVTYRSEDGLSAMVVTPILKSGKVLTPDELDEKVSAIFSGETDNDGIILATVTGANSVERANAYAQSVHEMQEQYYAHANDFYNDYTARRQQANTNPLLEAATQTAPETPEINGMGVRISGTSENLSKRLGKLLTEYEKIAMSGRSGKEYSDRVEKLTRENSDVFRDYLRETGSELTYPGLIDMFDKEAKRAVNEIRKGAELIAKENLRDATLKDMTVNSFKQGYYNTLYGEEMYKALGGRANNAAAYQAELNKNDYQFAADSLLGKAVSGAAGQIGQMARNATNPITAGLVGAGIGGAAMAGQVGPLVALPDELISIPAAAGAGYMLGSAANMMKVESGLAYDEMIQNGISPETASKIALVVGGANAAIEAVQLDDLLKSFKILSRSGATENAAVNLAKALLRRGVNVATETGEEVAQEAVTIGGAQLANKLDKGEWAYSGDEMRNRLLDTAGSSALTFGVLGAAGDVAGAGIGAYSDYRDTSRLGREIRNQNDVENVYDEGLRQGTGTEAYRQARRFTPSTASDYRVGRQAELNAKAMADEARMARLVNERTGYNVNYRDDMPNYAAGTNSDGNIDINANKGQRVDTVMHEIGHIDSPEAEAAAEKTIEILKKSENVEQFEARKNVLRDTYDRQGIPYTDELLEREIATDMKRGMYRTATEYDKVTRTDNYDRDRFVPNTVRRVTSNVKSAFGGMVTNENTGITISAKDANTIREAWERADNAAAGAYRAGNTATSQSPTATDPLEGSLNGTDYSVETIPGTNLKYVQADRQVIKSDNPDDWEGEVYDYINNEIRNGRDVVIPTDDGDNLTISEKTAWKMGYRNYINKQGRYLNDDEYKTKLKAAAHIDELAQISKRGKKTEPDRKNHDFAKDGFNYRTGYFMDFDGKYYRMTISVGINEENETVYNIGKIKRVAFPSYGGSKTTGNNAGLAKKQPSKFSITNPEGNVKKNFSFDTSEQTRTDIDNEYLDAVNRGDMETAQRLVREQAERNGYSTDTDWRMDHQAPTREYNTPAYDLRRVYGEEIYSPMAARYYGDGAPFDQKAVNVIQSMKDNPEKMVSVYRAVPTSVKDTRLRNGDWVTITEDYAKEHGWRVLDDNYRIIKNEVPAKYLFTNGDSIHEFGYDNGQAEAYRNTENNAKSLDTVTYDDNGNIIPLSQRFNASNTDTRYSVDTNAENEDKDVRAAANSVIRDYNVRYRVKADDVNDTFNRVLEGVNDMLFGEGDVNAKYESVAETARDAAKIIASKMYYSDGEEATERYNALRREIKGTKINIDELAKSDIPDWNDFKKRYFGYFTIARDGIPLDSYYKELAEQYPEYFDETKHLAQSDQLKDIAEKLDSMKPTETPLNEADYNEAVENITGDIMDRMIELAGKKWEREEKERKQEQHKRDLKYTQAELDERLENQRKKFEDQQRRLEGSLAEVRKIELAYKKASEDRRKLLNVARRLNRMRTSPENLAKIPDILKELDTRSVKILEKGYTDKNGHEVMGRIDLQNLKTQYYKIAESDPNFIPDKNIESKIARLDKKQISEMDIGTVRDLTETLLKVEHEIRTHDKLINDEKRRTIAVTAGKSVNEINHAKGTSLGAAANALNKFTSYQLSPERMFRRLGGYAKDGAFESLATALNDGQRKSMEFEMNATKKFDSLVRQKKEIKRFTGDNAEWIDISQYDKQGRKLYITPAMRASLAEHAKNYSNLRHIAYGGITIPNRALYERGRISDAYNRGEILKLTPEQVKEIVSGMTDYEKQFAETAHSFFNEDCTNAINETSLALEGYEKAGVKNYFPIVSNKDFTVGNFESLIRDGTIEGMGMLKERKTASNPIVLEDITQVITRQMKNVGKYYGLAIPVRNFNRVYNAVGSNFTYSTKQAIHQKWGTTATDYIENLLTDLQDGRRGKSNKLDSLRGNYAQATLAVNVGVTLKQAASYPTAAAELGYKPLIQAMGERVTKEDRAIIDKYTPLLWYRSKGYSTNELGDWANGAADDWTSKMPAVMGWIQAMDIATTTKLWKASEFYVRDNFKDLERGSDAYYKKTAEVYNRVIENTQPNYTTMQRPDILRSPNKLVNALTMFKTQIMQNYNILYDAYGEYRAVSAEYKKNQQYISRKKTKWEIENEKVSQKIYGENRGDEIEYKKNGDRERLKTAREKLGLAISSQVVAAVVLNACDAIGRGIKGQLKKYYGDEDEDKITPKSAVTSYLTSCANTIAGTALGGSEAAQLTEIILAKFGIGNADKWNDIEVSAINGVNEVVSDIQAMTNTIAKNGASNPPAYMKAANSLAKDLGNMLGVPLKNVEDILSGMYNNIVDSLDDEGVIKPGVINRKRWDYYIKKYTGDPEVSNLSADTVEETERIKEALENGGFDKESGKTYVKYGDKTYELTQEQAKQYKKEVNSITDEYMKSLLSGKNVEDVIDVEATLYAADMTDEQYSNTINKLQEEIDKAKKDTSKASAEAALQEFIDGKSKKKVSVTGKYSELPEEIKQAVINKVNSVAAGEAQTHMQGDIENSSKLVYTEPYHGREPAYMSMFTSEKDNETGVIPTNPFASPTPEPTPEPTREPEPETTPTPTPNPNAERDKRADEFIQSVADGVAKASPDDASKYTADSLKINRVDSMTVDGKEYTVSDDIEQKIISAANEEYYTSLEKWQNNELNIEDIIGYTSGGKARTSEQADGTKVALTGKMKNEDGTNRFDELVNGRILRKLKEAAVNNAKAKYQSEITGAAATTAPTQVSSTNPSVSSADSSPNSGSSGGLPFETSAEAAEIPDRQVGETIASTAEKYVGTPYVWGGESENGWDCSGYVINIFDKFGIHIPERTTQEQWRSGTGVRITNQEDLQPGDCLYFANSSGDVHHVAIYMGDGMMVHAKGKNYGTVTESFANSDHYQSEFIGAKRYYTAGDSTVIPDTSSGTRFRARSGSSGTSRSSGSTRFRARSSGSSGASGVTQFRARSASGAANSNGIRFRARDTFLPSSSFIGNSGGVTGFVGGTALTGYGKSGLAKIEIPKFI